MDIWKLTAVVILAVVGGIHCKVSPKQFCLKHGGKEVNTCVFDEGSDDCGHPDVVRRAKPRNGKLTAKECYERCAHSDDYKKLCRAANYDGNSCYWTVRDERCQIAQAKKKCSEVRGRLYKNKRDGLMCEPDRTSQPAPSDEARKAYKKAGKKNPTFETFPSVVKCIEFCTEDWKCRKIHFKGVECKLFYWDP